MRLTNLSSHQLSYLDKTELVRPKKFGNLKHPVVVYSWSQILEIKTIIRLREKLSLQEVRAVLDYLGKENYKPSLFKMSLLFFNSKLYWVKDQDELRTQIVELTKGHIGQIILHTADPIGDVILEVQKEAQNHKDKVPDFDTRTKGTPLNTGR